MRVRLNFGQNAHVCATCVRPKIECANVRACEAKNRRNSQFDNFQHKLNLNRSGNVLQNVDFKVQSKSDPNSELDYPLCNGDTNFGQT